MTGFGEPVKSRRGVYYDLTKSPYEFTSPYGDVFKFSSRKKLEMYTRDVDKELSRVNKLFARNKMDEALPAEIMQLVRREAYRSFYRSIEG